MSRNRDSALKRCGRCGYAGPILPAKGDECPVCGASRGSGTPLPVLRLKGVGRLPALIAGSIGGLLMLCLCIVVGLGGLAGDGVPGTPTAVAGQQLESATEEADGQQSAPLVLAINPTETLPATVQQIPSVTPSPKITAAPTATETNPPPLTATSLPPTVTAAPSAALLEKGQVVKITDGDTIRVLIQGQEYPVRYIGMDTPEMGSSEGETAKQQNAALVSGQTVRLEKDVSETDRYGRLLRYVWVGDVLVNAELVRLGYARAKAYPPDTRYQTLLEAQQRDAEAAQRGIWATAPRAAQNARLRAGPGVAYAQVGSVPAGQALQIVARDAGGEWYQLVGGAWIAGSLVANAPSVAAAKTIPTLAPAPTLAATPRPAAPSGSGRVQITGMLRDGVAGRLEPDEYVEIKNVGDAPQVMTDWRLESERRGSDAGQVFYFPEGFAMQPGQVCRVYTNEMHAEWCGLSFGHGQGAVWSNSEPDAVLLYDATGSLVSRWD